MTTITASDFKPMDKGALRGFVTLKLPSGLVLKECTFMNSNDKEWIGLPGKPQIDREGKVRKDAATGKTLYVSIVDFDSKEAHDKFQDLALAAVKTLLARGSC
jgi:hypothetical protein